MAHNVYIYILIMFLVSITIRLLPMTIFRKPIRNRFVRSFLYYVPYVTLAVMTFPAIITATQNPVAGLLALIAGVAIAWAGGNLFVVAAICCAVVYIAELFLL